MPDPMNDRVGNNLLSRIMGAEVRPDPSGFDIGFAGSATQLRANLVARKRPRLIPVHDSRVVAALHHTGDFWGGYPNVTCPVTTANCGSGSSGP